MSFPFDFLRYLNPLWYYHLPPGRPIPYFVDPHKMSDLQKAVIELDSGFSTHEVMLLDGAWQGWNRGVIETDPTKALDIASIRPSLEDNYRFLRKYFAPVWSWYVLGIRLLTVRQPLAEIRAFWKTRHVQRIPLQFPSLGHTSYTTFKSSLVARQPLVSIIIPTLNRYTYLKDVLHDLEHQDYPNFEVIVVDQSEPFYPEFYRNFNLKIHLIRQKEKALWKARNQAIRNARGELILLFDDDSRVESHWIRHHIQCIDFFKADISAGVSVSAVGAPVPPHYSFFRWSDQLDTGNVMIRRAVFTRIGLFDRQFERQRMGDGEFGLRAYLQGFLNISHPYARRLHLKVGKGGLRQMGSWDAFRPSSWWAPRPIPSVLYLARRYFGNRVALLLLLQNIPLSLVPYQWKGSRTKLALGIPFLVLLFPLVAWQVIRSWRIASRMLKEGPKIEPIASDPAPSLSPNG